MFPTAKVLDVYNRVRQQEYYLLPPAGVTLSDSRGWAVTVAGSIMLERKRGLVPLCRPTIAPPPPPTKKPPPTQVLSSPPPPPPPSRKHCSRSIFHLPIVVGRRLPPGTWEVIDPPPGGDAGVTAAPYGGTSESAGATTAPDGGTSESAGGATAPDGGTSESAGVTADGGASESAGATASYRAKYQPTLKQLYHHNGTKTKQMHPRPKGTKDITLPGIPPLYDDSVASFHEVVQNQISGFQI
jgi:hypothetical protein